MDIQSISSDSISRRLASWWNCNCSSLLSAGKTSVVLLLLRVQLPNHKFQVHMSTFQSFAGFVTDAALLACGFAGCPCHCALHLCENLARDPSQTLRRSARLGARRCVSLGRGLWSVPLESRLSCGLSSDTSVAPPSRKHLRCGTRTSIVVQVVCSSLIEFILVRGFVAGLLLQRTTRGRHSQ